MSCGSTQADEVYLLSVAVRVVAGFDDDAAFDAVAEA